MRGINNLEGVGGINPSGTLEISANGTYDVTTYASAEVAVTKDINPEKVFDSSSVANGHAFYLGTTYDGVIPVSGYKKVAAISNNGTAGIQTKFMMQDGTIQNAFVLSSTLIWEEATVPAGALMLKLVHTNTAAVIGYSLTA